MSEKDLVRVTVLVPADVRKRWRQEALDRGVSVGSMIRAAMRTVGSARDAEAAVTRAAEGWER